MIIWEKENYDLSNRIKMMFCTDMCVSKITNLSFYYNNYKILIIKLNYQNLIVIIDRMKDPFSWKHTYHCKTSFLFYLINHNFLSPIIMKRYNPLKYLLTLLSILGGI